MAVTKRDMLAAAGAATAAAALAGPALAQWQPSERYPDPAIRTLDASFNKYRLALAAVERIASGCRFNEGAVYFGDARCLLWSDIANNRIMRCDPDLNQVAADAVAFGERVRRGLFAFVWGLPSGLTWWLPASEIGRASCR